MRKSVLVILTGALVMAWSVAAQATVIVSDNFDSYASQAAFESAWAPIGTTAPQSGVLSTEQAFSPTQSIKVPGTGTSNQYRNQSTFAGVQPTVAEPILRWSFKFYDAQDPIGNPQRNYANLQTVAAPSTSPAAQLISLGLNNNLLNSAAPGSRYMARVLGADGGTGAGAYFKLDGGAGTARSIGWHELRVDIKAASMTFFVDGIECQTLSVGAAGNYTLIRIGSGLSNGNTAAYFDDMKLELIPEPMTLGLLALGSVLLARRSRRQGA